MCNPHECVNAELNRGDDLDDWIEGPCGENPGHLLSQIAQLCAEKERLRAGYKKLSIQRDYLYETHYGVPYVERFSETRIRREAAEAKAAGEKGKQI